MNNDDLILFHQAEAFANSGQNQNAYELFRDLRDRGNSEIEILFWIVQTTSDVVESRQTLDAIKHMQPNHPLIPRSEVFHNQKLQTAYTPIGPVLFCPYCRTQAPTFVQTKVSTAGWVIFVILLIIFFPLCWIGLLIREEYRVCRRCGSKIAATS